MNGAFDHPGLVAMVAARSRYHPAVLIRRKDTSARAGPLMSKRHPLAASANAKTTTSALPAIDPERPVEVSHAYCIYGRVRTGWALVFALILSSDM